MSVIMLCGSQGSGKSSLTANILLVNPQTAVLNRDKEGGNMASLLPKLEQFLKDQKDVILDNTFPTIESRKPFIELCQKYNTDIKCKVMETSLEDAQFNIVERAIKILGTFPTPEVIKNAKHTNIFPPGVLFKYKKEFEKPNLIEGFSQVESVKFTRKHDPSFTNKALILDYDGTLRECIGGNGKFPVSIDQIEIKPRCAEIIKTYADKGYRLLGVSNQSGVAKGDLTHDRAVELFEHTNKLLGLNIEYQFCPHSSVPPACYCRKPQVGFGVDFILKYKLKAADCYFVGDMTTDHTFSNRCGFQYIDQKEFFK